MNIKATNLTINVADLDRSITFYLAIGFALKNRWDNHYAQLTAPGIEIGLHPTDAKNLAGNSGNVSIGFTTDDWEGTKVELKELTIPTTDRVEAAGGQFIHFNDPDGTGLYFIRLKW